MPTTIKVRQNGSLLVDGDDVTLIDWNGNPYPIAKRPFALCRCGRSRLRPFWRGTHRLVRISPPGAAEQRDGGQPASS